MHALPVVVEELVSKTRLLVEEDESAEVGLFIGATAQAQLWKHVLVDVVVGA